MFKREIRGPIWALFLISYGGLLLHLRIHPPVQSVFNCVPLAFGGLNVFVLPFLFNHARTVAWAYVLNAATVLVGAVTMAYFSVTTWEGPVTWEAVLLRSTFPDIVLLTAKLPIAHAILRHFRPAQPVQGDAA